MGTPRVLRYLGLGYTKQIDGQNGRKLPSLSNAHLRATSNAMRIICYIYIYCATLLWWNAFLKQALSLASHNSSNKFWLAAAKRNEGRGKFYFLAVKFVPQILNLRLQVQIGSGYCKEGAFSLCEVGASWRERMREWNRMSKRGSTWVASLKSKSSDDRNQIEVELRARLNSTVMRRLGNCAASGLREGRRRKG